MSDATFYIVVGILIVLFAGEPDLMDSIKARVADPAACQQTLTPTHKETTP